LKKHSENLSKIKVLMVGPYPPPYGGIAVVVRDLMDSTLKDDFDIELLRTTPKGKNEVYRFLSDIKNLFEELIKFKPDIVHIHTSYDWGWPKHITYITIAKIINKEIKVILPLHAYDKKCKNNFPFIWFRKYIYSPKFAFELSDGIIVLSEDSKKKINQYLAEHKIQKPAIAVSNGILLNRFHKAICKEKYFNSKSRMKLLFVGGLYERKGIAELINLFEKIEKSNSLELIIAGRGPYEEALKKELKNSRFKKIHYMGKISEHVKICLLKEGDVFLLPSDNEGIPIAILEGLAGSCAIITTRVGAIPEVLEENKNCIFIKPHQIDELWNAMTYLDKNREVLNLMKENNKILSMKFSWERKVKDIFGLYKAVLRGDFYNER